MMRYKTAFLWILLNFNFQYSLQSESDSFSSESSEDSGLDIGCTRLPPNVVRSAVEGESGTSIVDYLNNGNDSIFTEWLAPPEVILVLGNSGCGKTTLTLMLAGNLTKQHVVLTHGGSQIIVDENERIGAPSTKSRTIVPELIVSPDKNYSYFDCPGFDDTRGPTQDVLANIFMNRLTAKITKVKLLFLVTYPLVTLGIERSGFDLLANHATKFVKALKNFEKSIGLVVTKVDSSKSDTQILRGVADFLETYKRDRESELEKAADKEGLLNKIHFVNILLKGRKETTDAPKLITFSKNPEKCGPLSESTAVNGTRIRVLKLIKRLKFTQIVNPSEEFGFSLKAETKLNIHDYVNDLNQAVSDKINQTLVDMTEWYDHEVKLLHSNPPWASQKLLNIWKNIATYQIDCSGSPTDLFTQLSNWYISIGYNSSQSEAVMYIKQQQSVLEFFDLATGSQAARKTSEWCALINATQIYLENGKEKFKFNVLTNHTKRANDEVVNLVKSLMNNATGWLRIQINNEVQNTPKVSQSMLSIWNISESLHVSKTIETEQFAETLKAWLQNMGYNVPSRFQREMHEQDKKFKMFNNVLNRKAETRTDVWLQSVHKFQQEVASHRDSYIQNVTTRFGSESNNRITNCIKQVKASFFNWFTVQVENEKPNYPRYSQSMRNIWNIIGKLTGNRTENPMELLSDVNNTFTSVGLFVDDSVSSCIDDEFNTLSFFDETTGRKIRREYNSWYVPLNEMVNVVENYKNEYHLLAATKFVDVANEKITETVKITIEAFSESSVIPQIDNSGNNNIPSMLKKIKTINKGILDFLISEHISAIRFGDSLHNTMSQLGFVADSTFLQSMRTQESNLVYLDEVVGNRVERTQNSWQAPVRNVSLKLIGLDHNIERLADNAVSSLNNQVKMNISSLIDKISTHQSQELSRTHNVVSALSILQSKYSGFDTIMTNKTTRVTELGSLLRQAATTTGLQYPSAFQSSLSSLESSFRAFDSVSGYHTHRSWETWVAHVQDFQTKTAELIDWYAFLVEVQVTLNSYEFLAKKIIWSNVQDRHWELFLQTKAELYIQDNVRLIGRKFENLNNVHYIALRRLFREATEEETITCGNGKHIISSNNILISKFVDKAGNFLKNSCHAREIQIYAKKKIYVDASINANGKTLNLVLASPNWQIVGSPSITLTGPAGPLITTRAQDGSSDGEYGSAGANGHPGGPGGNFLGFATDILNSNQLSVYLNGGKGGNGQDGGNGAKGRDGTAQGSNYEGSTFLWLVGSQSRTHFGQDGQGGGNGGNAGLVGHGGYPGKYTIRPKDKFQVYVESRRGIDGDEGVGGKGGEGGHARHGTKCTNDKVLLWSPNNRCHTEYYKDGNPGNAGWNSSNILELYNWSEPLRPDPVPRIETIREKFVSLFGSNQSFSLFAE